MSADLIVFLGLICGRVALSSDGYGREVSSGIGSLNCGSKEYRCDNGQCINTSLVCDTTAHCQDGSDESSHGCGNAIESRQKTGLVRISRGLENRVHRKSRATEYSCLVPPQPQNGTWKLHRDFCDNNVDCDVEQGSYLEPGFQLVYTCDPGTLTRGPSEVFCGGRGKWSTIPVCEEIKCPPLNTVSTTSSCYRHGKQTSCDIPVLPDTRAIVYCQSGYTKDTISAITRREKIECSAEGFWNPQPIICVPACGVAVTSQNTLVYNGTRAQINEFPWHATLYREIFTDRGPTKEFQCGGTVIHTRMVLTAAHCVYDEQTKTTLRPSAYFIATGNVFRDYDSALHNPQHVQRSSVRHIYQSCHYQGLQGNYIADIALLELQEPVKFSSLILPACLDVSGYSRQILEPGAFGRVAGFGITERGTPSGILQTITVPYVSFANCRKSRHGNQDEVYITGDKFCAGYTDGSAAVCQGDSGGGLVFRKNDLWYVMGVVSVSLGDETRGNETICETHAYALYTRVEDYFEWIQDVLSKLERNEYFTSACDIKCSPFNSESTTTECFLSGQWTVCDFPVPPTTRAKVSCREGYTKTSGGQETVECKANGRWDPNPIKCVSSGSTMMPSSTSPSVPEVPVSDGRGVTARMKCDEYRQLIPSRPGSTCAAFNRVTTVLVPDRATENEFPYMAAIGYESRPKGLMWLCGGALISENFVISTVRCAFIESGRWGEPKWARFGDLDLAQTGEVLDPQERRIAEIIRHPSWNSSTYYHDIALFKLESPVTLTAAVLPACIHMEPSIEKTTRLVVTGWGLENWADDKTVTYLRKIGVNVADHQTCNSSFLAEEDIFTDRIPNGIVDDWMICTDENNDGACQVSGNGNPLVIPFNPVGQSCMYDLVGLSSLSKLCGSEVPRVYTRVYNYIRWIESIVWRKS